MSRRPIYPKNPSDAEEYEREMEAFERAQEDASEREREEKAEQDYIKKFDKWAEHLTKNEDR